MKTDAIATPILIGKSGARVVRFQAADGSAWIEKTGRASDIVRELDALSWCAGRLPVARILAHTPTSIRMSLLPGVNLTESRAGDAVCAIACALRLIHSVPAAACPLDARWERRIEQGEANIEAGLVDESDFDDENMGRPPRDILAELKSMPPLPDIVCFTHGDACPANFLAQDDRLTGIVDLGRAGIAHPAQDWALALRSTRHNFGVDAEQSLRQHVPPHCQDEDLLRRFRLLDELF